MKMMRTNKISDQEEPKLSVVIPCYNESSYIENTLRSLQKQNFKHPYEIIIVDNNSTDDTVAKSQRFPVRIISEPNPGVCWARQAGTSEARAEIIVSTDADTVFNENWLENIYKSFSGDPDVVAVSGPFTYFGGPSWVGYADILFAFINMAYKLTGRVLYAPAANFAFRKDAWDGYNTTMTQYGDELDLLRKLRRKGRVIFSYKNSVETSPRRLRRGLFYNIFFSFFLYSFLEYNLNRIFRRRFFGQSPAIRDEI